MTNQFHIMQSNEDMDIRKIRELLTRTYWTNKKAEALIQKCIENSLCYGAFTNDENTQIGFARVITDFATTYYICDVVVDEQYRGIGVGKALIQMITSDCRLKDMLGMLLTDDAHGLYQQYGFKQIDGTYMARR